MIGLLLAECLLLKSLQICGVPQESSEFVQRVEREIVALNRYSVPLKVMTIGLMQLGDRKIRHGEVYRLLREYRDEILSMKEDVYIKKDRIRQAFGLRGEQLLQLFGKSKGGLRTTELESSINIDHIVNQVKGNTYGKKEEKKPVLLPQTRSVLQEDDKKGGEVPPMTPYEKKPYEELSDIRRSPIEKLLFELREIDQNAIEEKDPRNSNRLSSSIVSAVDKLTDLLEEEA